MLKASCAVTPASKLRRRQCDCGATTSNLKLQTFNVSIPAFQLLLRLKYYFYPGIFQTGHCTGLPPKIKLDESK
jgi:hypothetical protein